MNVFKNDCPHCGAKSVAFTISVEKEIKGVPSGPGWIWDTFAQCGHCRRGIVATFEVSAQRESPSKYAKKRLLYIAPKRLSSTAPKHTPENVARFFEQAMDNLPKNWDAAGSMFRKALDTGLKSKFSEIEGSLHDRIKEAAEKQMLTPDLAAWAHQIRLGGNEAAHEGRAVRGRRCEEITRFYPPCFPLLVHTAGHAGGVSKENQEGRMMDSQVPGIFRRCVDAIGEAAEGFTRLWQALRAARPPRLEPDKFGKLCGRRFPVGLWT